jgi:hypothetical protein
LGLTLGLVTMRQCPSIGAMESKQKGSDETRMSSAIEARIVPNTRIGRERPDTANRAFVFGLKLALVISILVASAISIATVSEASLPHNGAYPGTLEGPFITSELSVVACPSSYGVDYGSGPGPKPVVGLREKVSIPTRLAGKLSLYSDRYRSIYPLLGPSNWKCRAEVGADGGTLLDATPRGANLLGEQLSYSLVPACVGCAFDVYCPFASAAINQSADQGSCPTPPGSQSDEVIYQTPSTSAGTLFVEDPPGISGSMTPYDVAPLSHSLVTAGYLSYSTVSQPLAEVLSCTLPGSEIDVCQKSWAEGFAEHAVLKTSPPYNEASDQAQPGEIACGAHYFFGRKSTVPAPLYFADGVNCVEALHMLSGFLATGSSSVPGWSCDGTGTLVWCVEAANPDVPQPGSWTAATFHVRIVD